MHRIWDSEVKPCIVIKSLCNYQTINWLTLLQYKILHAQICSRYMVGIAAVDTLACCIWLGILLTGIDTWTCCKRLYMHWLVQQANIDALVSCSWLVEAPDGYIWYKKMEEYTGILTYYLKVFKGDGYIYSTSISMPCYLMYDLIIIMEVSQWKLALKIHCWCAGKVRECLELC